jgi:gas vesicle protein
MKRKALMFVLAIGAIAGFASGLYGCRYRGMERRQAFEDHVADVCTRAAERAREHRPDSEKMP